MTFTDSNITTDLSHESAGSSVVPFIVKLPDPDVKCVVLAPTVIVVKLEALDVTLAFAIHSVSLQGGGVSLHPICCVSVHKVTVIAT